MQRKQFNIFPLILAMVLAVAVFSWMGSSDTVSTLSYSRMISYFQNQQVTRFDLDPNNYTIDLYLKEGAIPLPEDAISLDQQQSTGGGLLSAQLQAQTQTQEDYNGATAYISYKLSFINYFLEDVENYIASYNEANPDAPMVYDFLPIKSSIPWLEVGFYAILMGGMVFMLVFMYRGGGAGGSIMNVGKAKVKDQQEGQRRATFQDVAGADEEKQELSEIVEFLKDPSKFNSLGARIPHGVLLVGPPGTGKTLLARACAGEAGVPFYSISGSDFVEMYVGVGASRVRDLFDKAKKTMPSIIFIDEIDAVGRQRGAGLGGGHDEREQTLNQLLVEMDGFDANDGVIVMAATNRADILDKALLRPGRFDRQVYVGLPDVKGREEILKVHTRNKPLGPDVDLHKIAQQTAGFAGADLENLVNEAALLAARRNKKAITHMEIEEASIKVVAGPEKKSRVVTEKEKRLTAYHEGGHAITGYCCPTHDPVHQISIIPRGMAGGYTMYLPDKDASYVTRTAMWENIVCLLGGRVAEDLVLDDISTGASNDLERATDTARSMVTRYGFSDKLGPVVYGNDPAQTFLGRDLNSGKGYSEEVASEIDHEIRRLMDQAYVEAKEILSAHLPELHKLATALMEREKISGEEFKVIMEGGDLPALEQEEPQPETKITMEWAEEADQAEQAESTQQPFDIQPEDPDQDQPRE